MASIADNPNPNPNQEPEQSIIPVLTVFKNKSILKNIFIVLNDNDDNNNNNDHTLLVGRHPNCNIVLTHPSISRFHLQIRFTPSSRSISLLDLSSVHGTWVSGRKLEHGVSVELKEGDSFQLGVSSRIYLLHFVSKFDADALNKIGSLSCDDEKKNQSEDEAFEVDNDSSGNEKSCCDGQNKLCGCQICFLSPPNVQSVDKSDNTQINEACPDVEMLEETNLIGTLKECFKHNICILGTKSNQQSSAEKQWIKPEASLDEKDAAAVAVISKESDFEVTFEDTDKIEDILTTGSRVFDSEDMTDSESHPTNSDAELSADSLSDREEQGNCGENYETELQNLNANCCLEKGYSLYEIVEDIEKKCTENTDPAPFDENGVAAVNVAPREHKLEFFFEENDRIDDILTSVARLFISENTSSLAEEAIPVINFQEIKIVEEVAVDSISDGEKENKGDKELQEYLNVKPCDEEGSSLDETVEDTMKSFQTESLNPSVTQEPDLEITDQKESQTPQFVVAVDGNVDVGILKRSCIEESAKGSSTFGSDEEGSSLDETVEDTMKSFQTESLNPSVTQEPDLEITDKKENQPPQSLVAVDGNTDVGILERSCVEESAKGSSTFGSDEEGSSLDETYEDTVKSFQTESLNPSVTRELDLEITDKIENQTPQSLVVVDGNIDVGILEKSCIEESAKGSSTFGSDILSKRDKAASAPQDRTRKSRLLNTLNVDSKFVMSNLKDINITNKPMPKDLFSVLDEGEMFTPNKENSIPTNTFHWQFMENKGMLEESKSSKSQRSHNLNANFSPIIYSAEISTSAISNKENLTPKEALEWMSGRKPLECRDATELRKKRVERKPLQSLMSPGGNCNSRISSPLSAAKSIFGVTARASNCGHISYKHTEPSSISEERKKSWDMVIDTSSLLNKESRKALQLLQGLKGTRLIIPQSVIRELGSIKQQFGIFRKTSEADLALKWIEECMENTEWWIHIIDCAFPMVEDHILDCALEYKRKDNVGQIVLLSDDIILKIKSMAKGLLCETVQQFRQSLVNPFSERFMWANSFPRGLTWSCQDDVVLREKYCCLPSKAGLKLLVS
ncbi:FHA domain-containing protein PS1 isoform X1 [Trifolium pratense]|uniref:FHA domain-containing protein PS1 isoform X1 n=1 Tax=Trifolium pratense TaxID=57577 RepID=UPI001E690DD9|nr:FHA domain-containing protein PS1 isoform X1 [Trifolium pratense]